MIKLLTKGAFAAALAAMLLLPFPTVLAGVPVGQWKLHPAYNNAGRSVAAFSQIFVLSDGSLYSYSPLDNEDAVYTYDKTGGLSDCDIATMAYCDSEKALLLVYSNGNMDILYEDGTIANCPDIAMGSETGISIGEIQINDDKAYIPIGAGLVVFNVADREITDFYRFKSKVNAVAVMSDTILCATSDSVMLGHTGDNLLDYSKWKKFSTAPFSNLFQFDGHVFGIVSKKNIYSLNKRTGSASAFVSSITATPKIIDDRLFIIKDTIVSVYSSMDSVADYSLPYNISDITVWNSSWWVSHGIHGLARYDTTEDGLICRSTGIKPNSPRRNAFHFMLWPEKGKMLAISGCQNYQDIVWPGAVMTFENDTWKYFDEDITDRTNLKYIDLTEAAVDPFDAGHVFVGSARQGLYEFNSGKFEKLHTWNNSGLENILDIDKSNFVSASSLMFDEKGNLWMTNNEVDTIIKVLKSDGSWKGLYYSQIAGLPTFKHMKRDSEGNIWINSSRGLHPGLFCLDYAGTIDDQKDDRFKFSGNIFTNQDGKSEEIYDLYFYDFDLKGDMWIGTNRGIFVLKNSVDFIDNPKPVFERIKIPRNDGSGLADYLFDGVMTTAMYIDQGNRKWIGTLDNGVFLLSEDGTETIEHFTSDNSPLPSDNILSISENAQDGTLFFATELGLAQYGGQARDPENTLLKSNVSVYPNPVLPDFNGYATITGLSQDCIVRIMNASGKLIWQGKSNGGSCSWNLTDYNGDEVPSGIYHAMVTDNIEKITESISITVIR